MNLPKLQNFGYALDPRANTAKRTLLRGAMCSTEDVAVAIPMNERRIMNISEISRRRRMEGYGETFALHWEHV